ncbi:hypothetical protein FRC10_009180 [Ceratobasidium sp. 414]|nr:hypothetical protein FRC10_009180 [Ceratobasidium sp. 414]
MVSHGPVAPKSDRGASAPPTQPDGLNAKLQQSSPRLEYRQDSPEPFVDQLPAHEVDSLVIRCTSPIWSATRAILDALNLFLENVEPEKLCELQIIPRQFLRCPPRESFSPDFRKLMMLQSQLRGAMEKSTNTLAVAIDLKHSEMAVRDLTTLVKLSSLVSKDSLARKLGEFAENARTTGRSLQKFGGHVGSAVDQTIAMNEYTIAVLEGMVKDEQASSLTNFFSPRATADIKAMWFEATELMKSNVKQLVDEALANTRALNSLDDELSVIHGMVAREDNKVGKDRAETVRQTTSSKLFEDE